MNEHLTKNQGYNKSMQAFKRPIIFIITTIVGGIASGFFAAIILAIANIYLSGHGYEWQNQIVSLGGGGASWLNIIFTVMTLGGGFGAGGLYLWLSQSKEVPEE